MAARSVFIAGDAAHHSAFTGRHVPSVRDLATAWKLDIALLHARGDACRYVEKERSTQVRRYTSSSKASAKLSGARPISACARPATRNEAAEIETKPRQHLLPRSKRVCDGGHAAHGNLFPQPRVRTRCMLGSRVSGRLSHNRPRFSADA